MALDVVKSRVYRLLTMCILALALAAPAHPVHASLPYGPGDIVLGFAPSLYIDINNSIIVKAFPYGNLAVTVHKDLTGRQYWIEANSADGKISRRVNLTNIGLVGGYSVSPDGSLLIVDGFTANLTRAVWEIDVGTMNVTVLTIRMPAFQSAVVAADWATGTLLVVSTNTTATIASLYSLGSTEPLWTIPLGREADSLGAYTCSGLALVVAKSYTGMTVYKIGLDGEIENAINTSVKGVTAPLDGCDKLAVMSHDQGLVILDVQSGELQSVSGVSGYPEELLPSPDGSYLAVLTSQRPASGSKTLFIIGPGGEVVYNATFERIERVSWSQTGYLTFIGGRATLTGNTLIALDPAIGNTITVGPYNGPIAAYAWSEGRLYVAYAPSFTEPMRVVVYNGSSEPTINQTLGVPLRLNYLLVTEPPLSGGLESLFYVGTAYDQDTNSMHSIILGYTLNRGRVIAWTPQKEIIIIPDVYHEISVLENETSINGLTASYRVVYSYGVVLIYTSGPGGAYYQSFLIGGVAVVNATATGAGEAELVITSPQALGGMVVLPGNKTGAQVSFVNETQVSIRLQPGKGGAASASGLVIAFKYPPYKPIPPAADISIRLEAHPAAATSPSTHTPAGTASPTETSGQPGQQARGAPTTTSTAGGAGEAGGGASRAALLAVAAAVIVIVAVAALVLYRR